jgi:hypothetical protein
MELERQSGCAIMSLRRAAHLKRSAAGRWSEEGPGPEHGVGARYR